MELYSIDKLMHETRQLAARYRETMGTVLPVTSEIARFDAARLLQLQLVDDTASTIDAIGTGKLAGKKILIKGRAIFETTRSSPRLGQLNTEQDWDWVVLVLFDDQYEAEEIYQASREDILLALENKENSNRKKRGAMSIAQFKIIGHRVWTKEHGTESEIWDNRADSSS
jgi:hypothetical protein